jgi:hypothetical protein
MINHIRTLLLNRGGDHGYGYDYPGEEFVLPTFRAKAVPTFLNGALRMLFGSNPDRLFLNYRMRQIMSLLHSTELEEFIYLPDNRVTYWPMVDDGFHNVFQILQVPVISDGSTLFVIGSHDPEEGAGISEQQWRLEVMNGNIVQVTRQSPPLTTVLESYTLTDALTNEIPLSGTGLNFRISTPAVVVTSRAEPQNDFGATLQGAVQLIGQSGIDNLFLSTVEPIPTLKTVWETHPLFSYKYSAILLVIAYYLEGTDAVGGTIN